MIYDTLVVPAPLDTDHPQNRLHRHFIECRMALVRAETPEDAWLTAMAGTRWPDAIGCAMYASTIVRTKP